MKDREGRAPAGHSPGLPATPAPQGPERWRRVGLDARHDAEASGWPNQRRDARVHRSVSVATTFIDPIRDPVTSEACYHTSEEDHTFSLSRRGAGIRCARPPAVGTRVLLQIRTSSEGAPIEVIGRARWTRVEYVPGDHGARAVAAVGLEFVGGSAAALDRYERWLGELARDDTKSTGKSKPRAAHVRADSVATPRATG